MSSLVVISVTMKFYVFIGVFVAFSVHLAQSLRCYTCSYDIKDSESNYMCVSSPWNLTGNPIRTCLPHFKFCIIVRIEAKESGKVTSFLRKCEESPMEDSDIESTEVVAHYRSCTTDLCNKGDGLSYVDEGHEEEAVAILVPDKSSASINYLNLVLVFSTSAVIIKFFNI